MDAEVSYPAAKRRMTSRSPSTSRSRSPSRTPTRPHRDDSKSRSRSYSRSQSRSPPRRRRPSPSDSSQYASPRRSDSRDGARYKSRSPSPMLQDRTSIPHPSPSRRLRFLPLQTLARAHARGITCAKFSPDSALLATASADATINIYSVPSNPSLPSSAIKQEPDTQATTSTEFKHIRTLRGHLAGVNALSWSPVSNGGTTSTTPTPSHTSINKFYTLASASDDKTILLWSPLSSDMPISPSPLTGHSNYVYSLCFSPKGNMLVSGSYDEAVWLWDVRSGRYMRQLPAHSDPVRGVDFITDGTMVCSCSTDGLIRIWDSGTGQCLRTLVDEDRKGVTSVMFAPNGKYLLAWTVDECIRLWDYVGGRCVKTYQGHMNKEFSLNGAIGTYYINESNGDQQAAAFVASGSEDGDIVVWDVTTKETLWRGEGHRDVVLSVDFCTPNSAEGAARGLLVSVGNDRDVRIWVEDVDDATLQKRAATLVHGHGMANGYEMDEDEDVDAQIAEMERGHAQNGVDEEGMDVDGEEKGMNGHHGMDVDRPAA